MYGRYKKTLLSLLSSLRKFQKNPNDDELLLALQLRLYRQLRYVERRQAYCKSQSGRLRASLSRDRLPKQQATDAKASIRNLDGDRERYKRLAVFIRSITDGIVFTLFDRYDIKPLALKEPAGAIGGKKGCKVELLFLRQLCRRGIRAILCDVTNCLRYGDICIDDSGTPRLIEVKSSDNTNARVDRQLEQIKLMMEYFDTDRHPTLYGHGFAVRRSRISEPQRCYANELNAMLKQVREGGSACLEVERGLVYFVDRDLSTSNMGAALATLSDPRVAMLNGFKDGSWSSYFPYTLSIDDPEDCFAFLSGEVVICIAYDHARLISLADGYGCTVTSSPSKSSRPSGAEIPPDAVLWFEPKVSTGFGACAVGWHFLSRFIFEFTSLEWIVREACEKTLRGPHMDRIEPRTEGSPHRGV